MSENEAPPRRKKRAAAALPPDAPHHVQSTAGAKRKHRKTAAEAPAEPAEVAEAGPVAKQRVAKAMARAGLCSRRDAEQWVRDGRVSVNGEVLASPARDVGPDDAVVVDGAPLPAAQKTRLFLFHKPRGLVTSDHDPEGRQTVMDYLREHWPEGPRVVTVGRLDINTEGLLLLTNDGGLARMLELPETGWLRRYRVRAKGEAAPDRLDALRDGITVDGMEYAGIEARIDRQQGRNCWMTMGLREGKNREIKRVLEHLGLEVNRLIRLSFGPFQLGDLPDGAVEEVRTRVLRDQLGEALASEAGVDFEGAAEVEGGALLRVAGRLRSTIALQEMREGDAVGGDAGPPIERLPRPPRGAGPRRHVSALREGAKAESTDAPRTRIARTTTTDRRDRTVTVEHRMRAVPERTPAQRGRDRHLSPSAQAKRVRVARSGGGRAESDRNGGTRDDAWPAAGSRRAGRRGDALSESKPKHRVASRPPGGGAPERPRRRDEEARSGMDGAEQRRPARRSEGVGGGQHRPPGGTARGGERTLFRRTAPAETRGVGGRPIADRSATSRGTVAARGGGGRSPAGAVRQDGRAAERRAGDAGGAGGAERGGSRRPGKPPAVGRAAKQPSHRARADDMPAAGRSGPARATRAAGGERSDGRRPGGQPVGGKPPGGGPRNSPRGAPRGAPRGGPPRGGGSGGRRGPR